MALEVKICGLDTAEAARVAVDAGATHLGFVHFARSPRHLSLDAAGAMIAAVRGRTRSVVLCVDPDDALVDAIAHRTGADMIQLHGRETPERTREIGERTGLPLVKAIAISQPDDLARARDYDGLVEEGLVERLLFDAKPPKGSDLPGGNGVGFDHALLGGWTGGPFWLAGGLGPDNAADAVRRMSDVPGFRGIDLSSGVERSPGVKDPARIVRLFDELSATV